MMEKIRTAANSIIVKIIFAIIILAFIFTGVGGLFGMQGNSADDERRYIAKVDGEGISRAMFEQQVNQAMEQFVSPNNDQDSLKPLIRSKVLLSLIDDHLGYQLSNTLNLKVSDEQVKKIIVQQPAFFVKDVFNNQYFLEQLQRVGYTPDSYAEAIRVEAQKNQLLQALVSSNFVLPIESDVSILSDQTRSGYYAKVNLNDLVDKSETDISEDDIQKYYQDNMQQFNRGDRIRLKFLVNSYSDAMKQAKMPTDDEVKEVYETNSAIYTQPAKYEFILVNASDEAEAQQLDSQINNSKSLVGIASTDLNNLGWFTEATKPDYLAGILTQKGESKVISIDGNYYVAFLQDIQSAEVLPFEYVNEKIKQELLEKRVNSIYDEKNEQLLTAKEKYNTLEDIAKATGIELIEPEDWQTKTDSTSLANNQELQNYIFSDEAIRDGVATQAVSELLEINDPKQTYIIQVLDYRPEGIAPYDEVHNQVAKNLTEEKSTRLFKASLEQIIDNLNNGLTDNRINFATKYNITRASTDLPKTTVDMIFSIPRPIDNQQLYGTDIDKYNSAIIAVLDKVENGERSDISATLNNIDRNTEYLILNNYLRSKAKIDMMPDAEM